MYAMITLSGFYTNEARMPATPNNPRKWTQAKISALKERDLWRGKLHESPWDARVAQRAVQIYKQRGGTYDSERTNTGLRQWTDEKWGYVRGDKQGRYLPEAVRRRMSPELKDAENAQKQKCRKQGKKYCPYLEETKRLMAAR
jgi:hypothetical protein